MKSNLYREIKNLTYRYKEIERLGRWIKHDKSKADEYMALYEEYEQIYAALRTIENEFEIDALKMQEIISSYNKLGYHLKVFRETINRDDDVYYTHRFLCCYLDENNPFYNFSDNESSRSSRYDKKDGYVDYAVDTSVFEQIHESIKSGNSIVVASSEECGFVPLLSPVEYLKRVNFIKSLTASFWDNFINYNFPHLTKYMLKDYLEGIEIESEIYKPATVSQKGEN